MKSPLLIAILIIFLFSCNQTKENYKSEIEVIIKQKNNYKLFLGYRISSRGQNCFFIGPIDSNYQYIVTEAKNRTYNIIKVDYDLHKQDSIKHPSSTYLKIIEAYKKLPVYFVNDYSEDGVEILEFNLDELNYLYYIPDTINLAEEKRAFLRSKTENVSPNFFYYKRKSKNTSMWQ